jgi:deaminated glutathione amidase
MVLKAPPDGHLPGRPATPASPDLPLAPPSAQFSHQLNAQLSPSPPQKLCLAAIQLNSGPALAENLEKASKLVTKAAEAGAQMVFLPENTGYIVSGPGAHAQAALPFHDHPLISCFAELARRLNLWIHIGSQPLLAPSNKLVNRSLLFDAHGFLCAHYDKIHLFDVDLPNGEQYRESASFTAGGHAVIAPTPWGKLGFSICYDVRFAALYRYLAQQGADFLAIPAAFTVPTGRAHWHILVRARAIETGAFVIASAQCGQHMGGRQTYGHSLIVDPWGEILAEAGENPGLIMADIDVSAVIKARQHIPSLRHDRAFTLAL